MPELDQNAERVSEPRIVKALKRHVELYPDVLYAEGRSEVSPARPLRDLEFNTDKKDL